MTEEEIRIELHTLVVLIAKAQQWFREGEALGRFIDDFDDFEPHGQQNSTRVCVYLPYPT